MAFTCCHSGTLRQVTFGQTGPPASPRQVGYLKDLLVKAGYPSFRDARRPLGLTQRQGSGKFTKAEASALIDSLLNPTADEGDDSEPTPEQRAAADALEHDQAVLLRGMPAHLLAAELERRGWGVFAPE